GQPLPASGALEHLPMYVRAGAIIPMQSPIEHTSQQPAEPLIFDIWPFGESAGTLYEDDGATFAYHDGANRRTNLRCRLGGNSVEFTMLPPEGGYVPPKRTPLVRLHGLQGEIERAECASGEQFPAGKLSLNGVEARRDAKGRDWLIRMLPDDGRP